MNNNITISKGLTTLLFALTFLLGGSLLQAQYPYVKDISRYNPTAQRTNATSVSWQVTFSEEMNFSDATNVNNYYAYGVSSGSVSSVMQIDNYTYIVTKDYLSGSGYQYLEVYGYMGTLNGYYDYVYDDASNYSADFLIDNTAPYATSITRNTPSVQTTNSTTLKWNVYFNEALNPATLTTADFFLSGSPTGVISSVTGSGSSYIVTVTNVAGNGSLNLVVSGSISDDLGNTGSTYYNGLNPYILDNILPYVTSITRSTPSVQTTKDDMLQWRVTFNESVNSGTVTTADFKLRHNGTVGTIASVTGSGTIYYVTTNNANGDGNIYVDFIGSATDLVGNAGTATYTFGQYYTLDNTAPKVLSTSIRSNNSNPKKAITNDNVTVSFKIDELYSIIDSRIEGKANTTDVVSGTGGTVTYKMTNYEYIGDVNYEITIADLVGNRTTFNTISDGSSVDFQKTKPNILIIEQPSDMIECEGTLDQFLFAIAAPSDKYFKLAYQWYKDGRPLGEATIDNGIYNFDTLDYRMSGVYTVEIWAIDPQLAESNGSNGDDDGDDDGPRGGPTGSLSAEALRYSASVFSEPTNAYVLQKTSFLKEIPSISSQVGNNLVFTFDANIYGEHNMENPTYWTEIDWFKGNVELENNARIAGADGSILTIQNIKSSDFAADYRVRLMSDCDTVWSNYFAITDEPVATITVQPIDVEGCEGTVVQLSVSADATVQGTNLLYQWMVNGQIVANEAGKFDGAMTPNLNVTLNPALNYNGTEAFTCKVTPVGFPNNGNTSAPAMITWKSAPVLTADLAASYSAKENDAYTLFVTASGDNVNYTWTKDGADLNNDNDTLSFASLTVADAGDYVVTVSNECGEITSMVTTLTVTTGPVDVSTSVDAQTGLGLSQNYPNPFDVSSTITFNTQVSGNATLTMTDMLGNTVAPLFNGFVNSGNQKTIQLNVNDMNLNTGTYFITLRMGDRVETRQISVVR